jgi:aminoglycoside phosphotransferase (APT) family kinase protein
MVVADSRSADTLDQVLDGDLGPAAVRQIAVDPLRHGLAGILAGGSVNDPWWDLELLRTKYKPSRKLTAYYRTGGRHLAVSWSARTAPESRITALVSPADPAMPQLGRLTKRGHLAGLLEALTGRQVESADRMSIDTIRYRPGQRHVLVARLEDGRRLYVKTDRDDSGARAVPVALLLADLLSGRCPGARVAEPVGYATDDSAALWWHAAGEPLSSLLAHRAAQATRAVERAGRVVRAMHDSPAVPGPHPALDRIGERTVQIEAASTLRAGEHIAALLPQVGQLYAALVWAAVDALDGLPGEAATFAHGDLKSDNLLVHDGQLRILDLDRSCWAEPAIDLGKLLADLRWWCPLGRDADVLSAAFRAGYGPCDPVRCVRAELIGVLFQLRLAARRCPVHDSNWEAQVRRRVTAAATALRGTRSA